MPTSSSTSHAIWPELSHPSTVEFESLVGRMREWGSLIELESMDERIRYVKEVNQRYDALANRAPAAELVELRLLRSIWAKKLLQRLLQSVVRLNANELRQICILFASLRTLLRTEAVQKLLDRQFQIGDIASRNALAMLLAEHAIPEEAKPSLIALGNPMESLLRLGPAPISKFRPSRKSRGFDPSLWLSRPEMSQLEFIDGDPDRIRVRGVELHSGDIGIVELNHPGDGLLESFLEKPGVAPHAMLYVTRRIRDPKTKRTLFQPAAFEIYEGGWRCVPITTALHPDFSWYSEWVRPKINGQSLSNDIGQLLSAEIDRMELFAFDFLARRIPEGGYFPMDFGSPCASCTNLIRVPFERAGIHTLPYPVTKITPVAASNLTILGMHGMEGIHTPTDILNESGYEKVGIVDNGEPEWSYAQALVIGRPDIADTFGGWMSQKSLVLKNLPHWQSIRHWKSAFEAFRVRIGQSNGVVGRSMRKLLDVDDDEVPKSVSETTIAFYLRSDLEASYIIENSLYPVVATLFDGTNELLTLSQLRAMPELTELVTRGMLASALKKENWYE